MPLPDHTNSPMLARDALVLGPSAALNRDPTTTISPGCGVCTSLMLFSFSETLVSQLKHYLDPYTTATALKVSRSLYYLLLLYLMVLKTISSGCGDVGFSDVIL